jgi:hypothetical protein
MSISLKNEIDGHENSSFSVSRSLKNEIDTHDHGSLSMSSSLENEIDPAPIELSLPLDIIPEPSFHLLVSFDLVSSSLSGETFPISSQNYD